MREIEKEKERERAYVFLFSFYHGGRPYPDSVSDIAVRPSSTSHIIEAEPISLHLVAFVLQHNNVCWLSDLLHIQQVIFV